MVQFIPHPKVEELLPSFLAHIPVAFSSPTAPPSLLPLLAPILRSRVRLLAGGEPGPAASVTDSWLSLLTWSRDGAILTRKLGSQDFQPHPSGEIEIGDYNFKGIRRTDRETLKASVELLERDIEVIYTWVSEDDHGSGWKVMDVKVLGGGDVHEYEGRSKTSITDIFPEEEQWYPTVNSADTAFFRVEEKEVAPASKAPAPTPNALDLKEEEGDDDDAYWAQYDGTPARTPAVNSYDRQQPSEDEYFARYSAASPALDPLEQPISPTTTTRNNSSTFTSLLSHTLPQLRTNAFSPFTVPISPPTSSPQSKPASETSSPPHTAIDTHRHMESPKTVSPRPTSPSSSTQANIAMLERKASIAVQTEVAIKQHISAQLKSLYRLAKGSGIDQEEFRRIVSTEMEILQMVDEDDASDGQETW